MNRKIIILIVIILLLGAGGFFWWRAGAELRELNRGLPEGVRVEKTLFTNEYWVNNKIDGYKIKIPKEWGGLEVIEYYEENGESGLSLTGLEGVGRRVGIGIYELKQADTELKSWAQEWLQAHLPSPAWTIEEEKIKNFGMLEVIKARNEEDYVFLISYFLKRNSRIYVISGISEESIRYIILNSKW